MVKFEIGHNIKTGFTRDIIENVLGRHEINILENKFMFIKKKKKNSISLLGRYRIYNRVNYYWI